MEQTTILKKIIAEQAILINKLQAHLVDNIKAPKKSSNKLTMAEARILVKKMIERQQKKNN